MPYMNVWIIGFDCFVPHISNEVKLGVRMLMYNTLETHGLLASIVEWLPLVKSCVVRILVLRIQAYLTADPFFLFIQTMHNV